MVAAKAAAAAPQRVASLTLLGYALNGWQMAASLVTRPHRLLPVCFPLPVCLRPASAASLLLPEAL
jgi:hypothetical protein